VDAIDKLMDSGVYADLIYTHNRYFGCQQIHTNPRFLPWHRAYFITYDEELSKAMGKSMQAPYWDWTVDIGKNPPTLFTAEYFGGLGDVSAAPDIKLEVVDPTISHGAHIYQVRLRSELLCDNTAAVCQMDFSSFYKNYDAQGTGNNRRLSRRAGHVLSGPTQASVTATMKLGHHKTQHNRMLR
jgi:hypothetical protein